jgi:hypothetical protein
MCFEEPTKRLLGERQGKILGAADIKERRNELNSGRVVDRQTGIAGSADVTKDLLMIRQLPIAEYLGGDEVSNWIAEYRLQD